MKKLSKILALALVLVMVFAVVSAFSMTTSAANIPGGTELYLKPNSNWTQSNAWFAAYFFGSNGNSWVKATSVGDGVYKFVAPTGTWTNVIFCRMDPSKTALDWSSKWDQTVDLTFDGHANLFTVAAGAWNNAGGDWSTYGSTCAHSSLGAAATCTTPQICNECGDPVKSALGHSYNTAQKCTRCGEYATYRVVGESALLNGEEWNLNSEVNKMTYNVETGLYTLTVTNVASRSTAYKYKVSRDGVWDDGQYPASGDNTVTVSTSGSTVVFTWDPAKKSLTADVTVPHVHNYVAGEVVAPTYTAGGYTVYSCSCGLTENRDETPALEVTFPEAVVTPIENPELTFALNFGIKDLEAIMANEALVEALFAKYGKMYVDYRLTIEGLTVDSVVFNADGTADGYLGGQYDEWSSDWVYVPFENVTIENGGSIMIMELAAKLMGKDGLRMTLEEIVAIVADFDCGVYFTPEFLAANPGMKVTLELIVFNEENGELVDVINVAKNEFTAPELPHVNTLVVGETNKIVVSGETLNDWGLPIEWVPFVATEDGFYSFVGDNGALAYIFTAEGGLVSATGAANLEAGTYLICLGNGLAGEFNVAVTKAAWVNALTVGENKILITDALDNGYGYYIVWVPFEVTEKANYTFGGEGLAVLVFDAAYGSVATTELEVGTYNICIAFGTPATTGVATVTVEKTAIGGGEVVEPEEPTLGLGDNTVVIDGSQVNLTGNAIAWYTFTPETSGTYTFACEDLTVYILNAKNMADLNAYVGNGGVAELEAGVTYYVLVGKEGIKGEFTVNVSVGGVVAEKNTMVVGNNHYVITDALLSVGYEFITIEITEPGTYVVAGGAPMKVYMWTIVNGMDDRNFVWNVDAMEESGFAPYFEITLQEAGTYYLGFNYEFVTDEREFDISITFKAPLPTEPSDPTPVDPVEPEQEEEELGFWANLWAKILAFLNSIVEFFKNLF